MAKNRKYAEGSNVAIPVPSGVVSGQAVVVGALPGVALTDRDADGESVCEFTGWFNFVVEGKGASNASTAIAFGDIVYLQNDGTLSVNSAGKRFGYAGGAVASGNTATTIAVKVGY